jgi:hypothetical protein
LKYQGEVSKRLAGFGQFACHINRCVHQLNFVLATEEQATAGDTKK